MTWLRKTREVLKRFLRVYKEDTAPEMLPERETEITARIAVPESEATREIVRSELNLEQNAVFTVSTFKGKSREVIRRLETEDGVIERKVVIGKTASGVEVGVLTTTHFKLYLVL